MEEACDYPVLATPSDSPHTKMNWIALLDHIGFLGLIINDKSD